jgi:hypothetical protein
MSDQFKYVPSNALLARILPTLLGLRSTLTEQMHRLHKEECSLNCGFSGGITDDHDNEKKLRELDSQIQRLRGKQEVVDDLLRPFEEESRKQREDYNARKCAEMMRI